MALVVGGLGGGRGDGWLTREGVVGCFDEWHGVVVLVL